MRAATLVLLGGLTVFGSGCHHRPTVARTGATAHEGRHPVEATRISAPGSVEPWSGEVKLASTEPGQIAELHVEEGQPVRKGELLARLEDSRERHAVLVAEAELRQAVAAAGGTSSTAEDLRAAEAELAALSLSADQQRRDARRAEALGAGGALARVEVDRAVSAARVDEARSRAAEARLLAVKRGARASDRQLLRARKETAEASLATARAALARREVRSTLDGVVLWSRYHVGEFYAPAQGPLVVIGDLSRLQVRLEIDDGDATLVREGDRCQLRNDGGEVLGACTVVRIAHEYGSRSLTTERPSARTDARVREVFVEIAAPDSFVPGQRVWGDLARSTAHASR